MGKPAGGESAKVYLVIWTNPRFYLRVQAYRSEASAVARAREIAGTYPGAEEASVRGRVYHADLTANGDHVYVVAGDVLP